MSSGKRMVGLTRRFGNRQVTAGDLDLGSFGKVGAKGRWEKMQERREGGSWSQRV